jgi:O-antigen ligase
MTPERLAYSFCIAVTIFALVGFIGDVFSLDTMFGKTIFKNGRFAFTLDGSNRAGFYLSASMLILLGMMVTQKKFSVRKDIFLLYIPTVLMFFSLILAAEKKSIFLLPFFVVFFVIFSKKYKALLLISLVGASVFYSTDIPSRLSISQLSKQSSTVSSRLNAWKISCRLIEQKPIFGHGFGSFMEKSGNYFRKHKAKFSFNKYKPLCCAHNINLNTFVETGLLGLIILNTIFFVSIIAIFRTVNSNHFVFYIGLILIFIYLELQFGNFIKSFQRTNYVFLLMGICAGISLKTNHITRSKRCGNLR